MGAPSSTLPGPAMRNAALRRFADRVGSDSHGARAELIAEVAAARGPLIEPAGSGYVTVTFVLVGPVDALSPGDRPAVRCSLFPGLEPSSPMNLIPGTDDVWWAEVVAPDDISTPYQFQTRTVPLPVAADRPLLDPRVLTQFMAELEEVGFGDPANPSSYVQAWDEGAVDSDGSADARPSVPPVATVGGATRGRDSELTLPGAAPYPWHDAVARRGQIVRTRVASSLLRNSRTIEIWVPPGSERTECYASLPVVLLLDGEGLRGERMRVDLIFDNLLARGAVPPFLGVLIHNAGPMTRMREFPCNAAFATFVADELLAMLRSRYRITGDPTQVVIGGYSYGGLAADWIGLTRPDAVGAVLSMSASLWWGKRPDNAAADDESVGRDDRPEWLTRTMPPASLARRPARFWIDVGRLESAPLPQADGMTQVAANRNFRDRLRQHGYPIVGYREQPGGHDLLNWRRTLPDGLIALLG